MDGFASRSQNLSIIDSRNQCEYCSTIEMCVHHFTYNLRTAFRHGYRTSVNSVQDIRHANCCLHCLISGHIKTIAMSYPWMCKTHPYFWYSVLGKGTSYTYVLRMPSPSTRSWMNFWAFSRASSTVQDALSWAVEQCGGTDTGVSLY